MQRPAIRPTRTHSGVKFALAGLSFLVLVALVLAVIGVTRPTSAPPLAIAPTPTLIPSAAFSCANQGVTTPALAIPAPGAFGKAQSMKLPASCRSFFLKLPPSVTFGNFSGPVGGQTLRSSGQSWYSIGVIVSGASLTQPGYRGLILMLPIVPQGVFVPFKDTICIQLDAVLGKDVQILVVYQ